MTRSIPTFLVGLVVSAGVAGCIPIQLQAPKDPIKIELNVKIDQVVRERLEDDINDLGAENPDLF